MTGKTLEEVQKNMNLWNSYHLLTPWPWASYIHHLNLQSFIFKRKGFTLWFLRALLVMTPIIWGLYNFLMAMYVGFAPILKIILVSSFEDHRSWVYILYSSISFEGNLTLDVYTPLSWAILGPFLAGQGKPVIDKDSKLINFDKWMELWCQTELSLGLGSTTPLCGILGMIISLS